MWPLFFPYSWLPCLWQVMVKRRHSLPLCCTSKEGNRKWRIAFMEYLQSSELEEGLHTQPGKLYFLLFTEERTDVQERWVTCPRALSQKSQCQNSNPVDTPKATILPREGTLVPFFFFFLTFLATPCGMWDLSSLTRNQTCTPCIGRQNLNHWAKSWFWSRLSYSRSQWNLRNNASWSTHHGSPSVADPSARKCLGWVMKIKRSCISRGSKSCHCVHREGGGLP